MTTPARWLIALLFCLGIGGALLSSHILAAATLLLGLTGLVLGYRKVLCSNGWDKPKELRLLHFAFWFFVLVNAALWALQGFSYESGKTFSIYARLVLLWPLLLALTYAGIGAATVFVTAAALSVSTLVLLSPVLISSSETTELLLIGRSGAGRNPDSINNIALLGGLITLTGSLYFFRSQRRRGGFLLLILGAAAVMLSMLSQAPGNLVALPALLVLLMPVLDKRLRIMLAIFIAVLAGTLLVGYDGAANSGRLLIHNNSVYSNLQNSSENWGMFADGPLSGFVSLLGWAFLLIIPLALFGRHLFSSHSPTAHLAVAGTMISTGCFLFVLLDTTFNRELFLGFYLLSIAGVAAALFYGLSTSYTEQRSVKVSATIITMNEEHHIAGCLQSARLVADEIIVLDSKSTDRTVEIAKQYADIVEVTDWPGFGVQKQRALEKATGEWVLSLDADERITPELAREINHRLAQPDADAYKLPWAVTIYGSRLDFGRSGRAPLRLFRREGVSFSDALVHERILIPKGRKTRTLRGRLTHYTHRDFGHSLEKSAKYAWLGSLEKHRKGKKTRTMLYPTVRSLLTFVQVYFIRFGFLDGAVGYLTAVTYAQVTFNKYVGLWTLSPERKNRQSLKERQ